jgi:ribose transport system ATP-binding protein
MDCGVAYVPENRELDAAFPQLSVCDNLSAGQISRYRTVAGMDNRRERADARSSIAEFSIQASSEAQVFSSLSGGNQQKVVIARWLRREPKVLLLDEPTQGVDVGARADVYASIRRAVSGGMAVVLVSSDFDELVNAADRVLVLRGGLIVADLNDEELDSDTLTHLAYTTKPEASQI